MKRRKPQKFPAIIPLVIGLICLIILVGGVGLWSVNTKISGAVIATGSVKVEANRQVVQHPEGGVVGKINIRDGDTVAAGDVLIELDGTLLASELKIVEDQLTEIESRMARLLAERDGKDEITFAPELIEQAATDEKLAERMAGQESLFKARLATLKQQASELEAQQIQIRSQIEGVEAQLTATYAQSELIDEELVDAESLLSKGLTQASRVLALRRTAAEIDGTIGQLKSQTANLEGAISRLNIRLISQETERREAAETELRDLQSRSTELAERRLGLRERLSRLEIRAPMSGTIYGTTVFALKAVVRPADPLLYVIPQGQPLLVQAQISANEIDSAYVGQDVTLRFSAFNQRTTPEIEGRVKTLSADIIVDRNTGIQFYEAEIEPKEGEIAKLGDVEIVPGMPVEALIETEARSPLSYLMKPLTDYFNRAFREA